jgi:hypothetical protein
MEEVEKNKVLIGVLEILVEEVLKNKVLIEELEILVEEVVKNKVLLLGMKNYRFLWRKQRRIKCYYLE